MCKLACTQNQLATVLEGQNKVGSHQPILCVVLMGRWKLQNRKKKYTKKTTQNATAVSTFTERIGRPSRPLSVWAALDFPQESESNSYQLETFMFYKSCDFFFKYKFSSFPQIHFLALLHSTTSNFLLRILQKTECFLFSDNQTFSR